MTVGERIFDRKPYEEVHLMYGDTNKKYHVRLGEDKKIVWCVMCFGRNAQLEPHLERAMCLSHGLRKQLAPSLKRRHNISFANVMFVTEDSLDKASFQALSHFWSMKVVVLPEVHEDKIKNVSKHLRDENIPAEHVFLKYYTWTMKSELAIISDVDVFIANPEKMADCLAQWFKNEELKKMQQEAGVSCMCRVKSLVGFNKDTKPQLVRQKKGKWDNLSYCFAIVTPNEDEAERYAEELKDNKGHIGKLSDQDHFSHYARRSYVLLHQNIMAFISWWNHDGIMENIIKQVIQISVDEAPPSKRFWYWTTMEFAESLFNKFCAIHCSSAFDVTKVERSHRDFVKEFTRKGHKKWNIPLTYKEENSDTIHDETLIVSRKMWAQHFLWNFNLLCRNKTMEIAVKIHNSIERYTNYDEPERGMSKAFFCLSRAVKRKEHVNWYFNMLPQNLLQDFSADVVKSEVKNDSTPVQANSDKGKKRKSAESHPWRQPRRQQSSRARGSSEGIAPWKKGRAKDE